MSLLNAFHVVSKLSASGGIGNQLLALLRKYDRKVFNPVVCSLREKGPLAKEIESLGIEVISLGLSFNKGFYPGAVRSIYALLKERNVHILRSHGYRAALHGVPAGHFAKIPCIVTSFHNIYMPRDRKLNRRLTNKFLSKFADGIVAVSDAVKKDIMKYDGVSEKKITVIYNGVNADRFMHADGQHIRNELEIHTSVPVIGTVGRLFQQKGQRYLIEALSVLKKDIPEIKLVIVGDGPSRNELKELAEKLSLEKNIIFTGMRRDIPELITAMDVFVFPSLWEGFGNALIEAMSSGKPIVASDIPPVREILDSDEQAVIVPPKHPPAIADAVKFILNNREKAEKLGQSAVKRAFSAFTIDITYNKYKDLYLRILGEKGIV